jgi:hypothetical protein
MIDPAKVEEKVEDIINADPVAKPAARAGEIIVHEKVGGMFIETVDHLFKIADALSRSGVAVPPHCRGNPGTVFAILTQAQEWGLPFMAVINQSYVTKGKGGVERIAYMAQLVHTLVETRSDLKEGLRSEFIGEGDEMICRVTGHRKNEKEPRTWESEKLGKIVADIGYRDDGVFKGSPLWLSKPKVQLHYSTSRDWARVHVPWVILGVYELGEIEEGRAIEQAPAVPKLVQALRDARAAAAATTVSNGRGFDPAHVNNTIIEGDVNPDAAKKEEAHGQDRRTAGNETDDEPGAEGRRGDAIYRSGDAQDPGGSGGTGGENPADGGEPAGDQQAAGQEEQDQAEIFPPDRKGATKPKGRR